MASTSEAFNVAMGAGIGAAAGTIYGLTFFGNDCWLCVPKLTALTAVAGALSGTTIGGIKALAQRKKYYEINGDQEKWNEFKTWVSRYSLEPN